MTRYNEPNSIPKELKGIKKRLDSIERSQIGPQLLTEKSEMRTPAPPGNFTVSSSVQISETGETNGVVNASWDPVTEATFGTPLEISQYELWGRPAQDGIWRRLTASPETSGEYGPLPTGESWTFRVRAIARSSTSPGEYSNEVTLTVAGDTTPPPVPSMPILTTRLGVISVQWDGMPSMPSDFSRIEIAMGPAANPTSVVGVLTGRGSVSITDQPYGELRHFRFRSVDRSGNRSNWSAGASIATEALVDEDLINTTIDSQIQEAKDKVADLEGVLDGVSEDVSEASQAAIDAQAAADKAIQDALNALQAAQGKNKVVIAPEAPSDTSELSIGDIFYNTTSNETYVWDGADWKSVGTVDVDVIIDALTASGGVIDLLEKEVDKKITTYYGAQPSSPSEGDLWLDSSDPEDMIVKRWNGTTWERFDNPLVEAAYELAGDAKAIADRKVQTFAGTSFPENNTTNALGVGDLFINTSTKKTFRWSGSAWTEILDTAGTAESAIHAALTDPDGIVQEIRNQADRAINTFYGSSTPSGDVQEGDLWLDSSDPNNSRLKRYNGSSWELFDNPLIQSAYEQVQNKFTLHYGDSAPSDLNALWIKGGVPHIYVDYGAEAVNWLNHDTGLSNWALYPASSGGSAEYNEGVIVLKGYGSRAESPIIPIETADPIRVATLIKTFGRAPGREDEQDARVLFGYHWYDENGDPTTTTPTQSASALYVKEGQWDQQSRALNYNDHIRGFRLRVSLSNQWTGDEIHIAASDIWQGGIRPTFDGDSPGFKWNGERFASTSSYAGPGWYPVVDPEVREAVARANGARQIADEKVRTFAQSSEPTGLTPSDVGDLWIDTDNHRIFRWDGTDWVEVVDPDASADDRIRAALDEGGLLSELKNQVDSAISTYYGASTPANPNEGDLWLDQTDPDNAKLKRFDGSNWVLFENPLVQSTYETLQGALNELDEKIVTYAQPSAPAGMSEENHGDLWINTLDHSIHRYSWNGTSGGWVKVSDPNERAGALINEALTDPNGIVQEIKNQADRAITTFYGSSAPTSSSVEEGDLWLDTSNPENSVLKRRQGSSWVVFENPRIQEAYTAAGNAQTTADGKVRTFAQSAAPTGMTEKDVGDLWIDTDDNTLHRWSGSAWVKVVDPSESAHNQIQAALGQGGLLEELKNQADRAINTFYGSTTPAASESQEGDLWLDTSNPDDTRLKRYDGSSWDYYDNPLIQAAYETARDAAPRDWVLSRGTDLVTNGTGYMGDNTNFTGLAFDPTDAPVGARGSFDHAGTSRSVFVDEIIPISAGRKYLFQFSMKQKNQDIPDSGIYGCIIPVGPDGDSLTPSNFMHRPGTLTTLTQPLRKGDTQVHLASAEHWFDGTTTHWRSFIFWNWTDPNGKVWSPGTISRWSYLNRYDQGGVDYSTGVITLSAPWSGPEFEAGHPVSNGGAGSTYIYVGSTSTVPTEWQAEGAILHTGLQDLSDRALGSNPPNIGLTTGFPEGVMAVRLGWMLNHTRGGASSNRPDSVMSVAAVSFSDATAAQQMADEKIRTFAQSAAPGGMTDSDIGDLWIDTDNHHIFRWDGSNWVEVVDPEASADSRIQAALQDGGLLEDLKNQVDAQIDTYYGATAPSSPKSGDLWLDQSNPDNARLKRYNGTTWDIFENPLVQSAYETAQEALDEADKKIQTFAQSSAPANNTTNDLGRGDLWIDTDDNSLHRWDGSKWAPVIDPAATARSQIQAALGPGGLLEELKNQVDAQIDTYYGSSTPSSPKEGDLWLDQSDPDNARLKRYDGSSWQIFENPLVQSAYQTAQDALGEADKKIRTFAQDSEPTGMTSDDVGDLWIDTNDKNKLYRYNGTSWVVLRDETIQDAFDLANTKGRIIFSPTAPTSAEDKQPQNMWIDTSLRDDPNGGAQIPKNTPHRWSGSAWVPITDADVIAAAKAAADARQAAQEAHEAAGSAQDTADAALSSANGKTSVYHSDSPPSGTGSPGDLWWQHGTGVNSGTIVGQWRWTGLPDFFINNYNTTTPFVHAQPLGNGEVRFTALHDGPHTKWSVGAQSNLADGKSYTHKFTSTGSIFVRVTSGGTLYQNSFTVTAEMLGDGGLWQKEEIGSEVIANLDVGKLTAGTGEFVNLDVANLLRTNILTVGSIDDPTIIADNTITTGKILVDQELWARLAQFVSIKAGQLDANEIWTNDAWIGHARAQMLTVGSVPSRALAIGVDELLLDPLWENSELWDTGGPLGGQVPNGSKFRWNTSSTYRQYGQSRVLYTYASSGSTSLSAGDRVYLSPDVKAVSPGDEFRLAYEARTTTSNHNVVLGIEVYNSSGVKISDEYVAPDELTVDDDGNILTTAHPLNTMFVIDGIVTVPSGGFQIRPWIGVEPGQTPTTGYWYISKVSMRAVMASEVADWRTRITGRGLEVINPDDISVIRLGAFDNIGMDLYQARVELDEEGNPIKNDDGTDLIRPHHTIHLHEDGTIGAEDIYARQSFEYKGTELEERFDELPRGMLTRISVAGSSLTNISSTGGFLDVAEIQFTMHPGRVYRIAARPINVLLGSSGTSASARAVSASLYWTKDGTRPTRDSERIFMDNHTPASTTSERVTFNCERLAHVNPDEGPLTIRVLLSLASAERSLNVQDVLSLFAEDLGWDTGPNGGIVRNYMRANASTPPPAAPDPVKTYKRVYGYTWHRTWQENGVISSQSQDAAYQGQTPYYTAAGRYRSMVGVKNMTTDLQGATITRVRVRLRMDHSHSASGGTVVMGFHGSGSRPSTFSGTSYRPGYRFSRGQEKWITLPSSLYNDFKNGNIKGVSFYSSSRSSEYYVKMSPGRVAFEITYEKS